MGTLSLIAVKMCQNVHVHVGADMSAMPVIHSLERGLHKFRQMWLVCRKQEDYSTCQRLLARGLRVSWQPSGR